MPPLNGSPAFFVQELPLVAIRPWLNLDSFLEHPHFGWFETAFRGDLQTHVSFKSSMHDVLILIFSRSIDFIWIVKT